MKNKEKQETWTQLEMFQESSQTSQEIASLRFILKRQIELLPDFMQEKLERTMPSGGSFKSEQEEIRWLREKLNRADTMHLGMLCFTMLMAIGAGWIVLSVAKMISSIVIGGG